jgi:SAM-dependent methyltransferase
MTDFLRINQQVWDERTRLHQTSEYYDVPGFRAGRCTLLPIETREVGDVTGRSLLHLQCHFGLDTLSWARRGARVTGADLSPQAIDQGRTLSWECRIPADFVCSSVEALADNLTGSFDLVFTSYGVLCWLADLDRWAAVIRHFLRPGGTFYMLELHPFADILEVEAPGTSPRPVHSYFHTREPIACPTRGSYADRSRSISQPVSYQWSHSLADVVTALLDVGLQLEFLHEFPVCPYPRFPSMQPTGDGYWTLPGPSLPLLFSLRATRVLS